MSDISTSIPNTPKTNNEIEDNIYHLENSESSVQFFCPIIKLDENNFQIWKKHFEMAVNVRLKMRFLLGEVHEPSYESNPREYRKWKACMDTVHSWLLTSIKPELCASFLAQKNSWRLWKKLNLRFNQSNRAMVYDILVQMY